tara:strand:+ start:403 stop:900 length:498 start_codon:yes stop_codon:yes gene_type:complete
MQSNLNLLLILALFVVGCSETVPEPFIEFSTIDDEIKCEFYGGSYLNYVFKTEVTEDYKKQFVEIDYFSFLSESNEYLTSDIVLKVPYIREGNLIEFTFEDVIKTAFEDSLQITESKMVFKVVINTETLKTKMKVNVFENASFSGEQNSEYIVEEECKRISSSSN